jgi:outer membrane protein OmpA-like peptidoglycan-associated protein
MSHRTFAAIVSAIAVAPHRAHAQDAAAPGEKPGTGASSAARTCRGSALYLENINVADEKNPMLIGNIRIAVGGRDLYDALAEKGRVATQGILFATGSARIRPESTPTLNEIGAMLKGHPDLRVSIEGHTDDVGDDASNLTLSQQRAAAVKTFLVETFGIDAVRLDAAGFGETKPALPNDVARSAAAEPSRRARAHGGDAVTDAAFLLRARSSSTSPASVACAARDAGRCRPGPLSEPHH